MSAVQTITMTASAKVNLGLAVMARRGDGYHEVETWLARISLADTLAVTLVDEAGVSLSVTADAAVPGSDGASGGASDGAPAGSDNLAWRAADAYLSRWGELTEANPPGVRLALGKRIPVAAGLGGGSSDAGAALRALAALLPLPLEAHERDAEIGKLAAALGADVAFFAADAAFALAKGRGERLLAAPSAACRLVLANPGVRVSAAEAYAWLVGFSPRLKLADIAARLAAGEEPRWHNALQPGVQRAHPVVRETVNALKDLGLMGAMMSGSGATCFAVAPDESRAEAAVAELSAARPSWWVRSAVSG